MRLSLIAILLLNLGATLLGVQTTQNKQADQRIPVPKIESFESSAKSIMVCGRNQEIICTVNKRTTVTLEVKATDIGDEKLTYIYSTTRGEILGEGSRVTWDLQGVSEGTHKATVIVRNSRGGEANASTTVDVLACPSCFLPDLPCGYAVIKSDEKMAHRGERSVFEVTVQGDFLERPDYLWTIDGGRIIKGQHTPRVEILVSGEIDSQLRANVRVTGFDRSCTGPVGSFSLPIRP